MIFKSIKNKRGGIAEVVIAVVMVAIALILLVAMFWGGGQGDGIKPAAEGLMRSAADRINKMNDIISGGSK